MKRRRGVVLLRRQRYRLRASVRTTSFRLCPEWVNHDGVYEGDIDPSSQDVRELRIRLLHPRDPEMTFLVEETDVEEVD